jgi:hypothetical protein
MLLRFTLILVACFGLAGCESVTTGVREKFSGPTYQTRTFTGDSRAIFDAARVSAEQLGFRITRAGAVQGVLDGVSGLASDDRLRGSRQRTIKVRLTSASEGGTEVAVLFTEVVEDDFGKGAGQATETSLRNHPLYEAFFGNVSGALVR